jgi:hypothetical protein
MVLARTIPQEAGACKATQELGPSSFREGLEAGADLGSEVKE